MCPLPSIGSPSVLTTRPSMPLPTFTEAMRFSRLTEEPFLEFAGRLEQHRTHVVLLEVQRDATDTVLEFDELTGLHIGQAVDAGDAVPHLEDGANLLEVGFGLIASQLLTQDGGYFGGFDLGHEVWDTLSKPVRRGCW